MVNQDQAQALRAPFPPEALSSDEPWLRAHADQRLTRSVRGSAVIECVDLVSRRIHNRRRDLTRYRVRGRIPP